MNKTITQAEKERQEKIMKHKITINRNWIYTNIEKMRPDSYSPMAKYINFLNALDVVIKAQRVGRFETEKIVLTANYKGKAYHSKTSYIGQVFFLNAPDMLEDLVFKIVDDVKSFSSVIETAILIDKKRTQKENK